MRHAVLEEVVGAEATHVISGRLCCPSTIERVVEQSVRFLRAECCPKAIAAREKALAASRGCASEQAE